MKTEEGNKVAAYDPEKYGEISASKFDLPPFEKIIGVYGTYEEKSGGSQVFTSFGLVSLSSYSK